MLVIHWTKQNKTQSIIQNGIRPTSRCLRGKLFEENMKNEKGIYVYPYSRNKSQISIWKRQLKVWDKQLGDYNGFVFRLEESDFPLHMGYWFHIRENPEKCIIKNIEELSSVWGEVFSGKIVNNAYDWKDIEMILPHRINPERIIRILKDREPKKNASN